MKSTSQRCVSLSAFVGAFVLLCTIEALYWPLVVVFGPELAWWQLSPLANFGVVLGFPVVLVALLVDVGEAILWGLSIAWSVVIFFSVKAIRRHITRRA